VLVLGQLTPAAASGVCGSDPNLVSPSGNVSDCVCDGGYEACTADDNSQAGGMTQGQDCSAFATSSYDCVALGACTICCATCAAECAADGVSTGCTACEAGERQALSRSGSATRVALPRRVLWWQSHRSDVWLWGNRQVQGGAGGGQLQQLSCECRCDGEQDGVRVRRGVRAEHRQLHGLRGR